MASWLPNPVKAAYHAVLHSVLSPFVKDFSRDDFEINISAGRAEFTRLLLKHDALDALRLPIEITEGVVERITLIIPWSISLLYRLYAGEDVERTEAPIILSLEGVRVVVRLREQLESAGDAAAAVEEALRSKLAEAEATFRRRMQRRMDAWGIDGGATPSTIGERVARLLLRSLRVRVRRVHVQFQHETGGIGVHAGLLLDALDYGPCDEPACCATEAVDGETGAGDVPPPSATSNFQHSRASFAGLRVYLRSAPEGGSITELGAASDSIQARHLVLRNVSGALLLAQSQRAYSSPSSSANPAPLRVEAHVDGAHASIVEAQFAAVRALLALGARVAVHARYRHVYARPALRYKALAPASASAALAVELQQRRSSAVVTAATSGAVTPRSHPVTGDSFADACDVATLAAISSRAIGWWQWAVACVRHDIRTRAAEQEAAARSTVHIGRGIGAQLAYRGLSSSTAVTQQHALYIRLLKRAWPDRFSAIVLPPLTLPGMSIVSVSDTVAAANLGGDDSGSASFSWICDVAPVSMAAQRIPIVRTAAATAVSTAPPGSQLHERNVAGGRLATEAAVATTGRGTVVAGGDDHGVHYNTLEKALLACERELSLPDILRLRIRAEAELAVDMLESMQAVRAASGLTRVQSSANVPPLLHIPQPPLASFTGRYDERSDVTRQLLLLSGDTPHVTGDNTTRDGNEDGLVMRLPRGARGGLLSSLLGRGIIATTVGGTTPLTSAPRFLYAAPMHVGEFIRVAATSTPLTPSQSSTSLRAFSSVADKSAVKSLATCPLTRVLGEWIIGDLTSRVWHADQSIDTDASMQWSTQWRRAPLRLRQLTVSAASDTHLPLPWIQGVDSAAPHLTSTANQATVASRLKALLDVALPPAYSADEDEGVALPIGAALLRLHVHVAALSFSLRTDDTDDGTGWAGDEENLQHADGAVGARGHPLGIVAARSISLSVCRRAPSSLEVDLRIGTLGVTVRRLEHESVPSGGVVTGWEDDIISVQRCALALPVIASQNDAPARADDAATDFCSMAFAGAAVRDSDGEPWPMPLTVVHDSSNGGNTINLANNLQTYVFAALLDGAPTCAQLLRDEVAARRVRTAIRNSRGRSGRILLRVWENCSAAMTAIYALSAQDGNAEPRFEASYGELLAEIDTDVASLADATTGIEFATPTARLVIRTAAVAAETKFNSGGAKSSRPVVSPTLKVSEQYSELVAALAAVMSAVEETLARTHLGNYMWEQWCPAHRTLREICTALRRGRDCPGATTMAGLLTAAATQAPITTGAMPPSLGRSAGHVLATRCTVRYGSGSAAAMQSQAIAWRTFASLLSARLYGNGGDDIGVDSYEVCDASSVLSTPPAALVIQSVLAPITVSLAPELVSRIIMFYERTSTSALVSPAAASGASATEPYEAGIRDAARARVAAVASRHATIVASLAAARSNNSDSVINGQPGDSCVSSNPRSPRASVNGRGSAADSAPTIPTVMTPSTCVAAFAHVIMFALSSGDREAAARTLRLTIPELHIVTPSLTAPEHRGIFGSAKERPDDIPPLLRVLLKMGIVSGTTHASPSNSPAPFQTWLLQNYEAVSVAARKIVVDVLLLAPTGRRAFELIRITDPCVDVAGRRALLRRDSNAAMSQTVSVTHAIRVAAEELKVCFTPRGIGGAIDALIPWAIVSLHRSHSGALQLGGEVLSPPNNTPNAGNSRLDSTVQLAHVATLSLGCLLVEWDDGDAQNSGDAADGDIAAKQNLGPPFLALRCDTVVAKIERIATDNEPADVHAAHFAVAEAKILHEVSDGDTVPVQKCILRVGNLTATQPFDIDTAFPPCDDRSATAGMALLVQYGRHANFYGEDNPAVSADSDLETRVGPTAATVSVELVARIAEASNALIAIASPAKVKLYGASANRNSNGSVRTTKAEDGAAARVSVVVPQPLPPPAAAAAAAAAASAPVASGTAYSDRNMTLVQGAHIERINTLRIATAPAIAAMIYVPALLSSKESSATPHSDFQVAPRTVCCSRFCVRVPELELQITNFNSADEREQQLLVFCRVQGLSHVSAYDLISLDKSCMLLAATHVGSVVVTLQSGVASPPLSRSSWSGVRGGIAQLRCGASLMVSVKDAAKGPLALTGLAVSNAKFLVEPFPESLPTFVRQRFYASSGNSANNSTPGTTSELPWAWDPGSTAQIQLVRELVALDSLPLSNSRDDAPLAVRTASVAFLLAAIQCIDDEPRRANTAGPAVTIQHFTGIHVRDSAESVVAAIGGVRSAPRNVIVDSVTSILLGGVALQLDPIVIATVVNWSERWSSAIMCLRGAVHSAAASGVVTKDNHDAERWSGIGIDIAHAVVSLYTLANGVVAPPMAPFFSSASNEIVTHTSLTAVNLDATSAVPLAQPFGGDNVNDPPSAVRRAGASVPHSDILCSTIFAHIDSRTTQRSSPSAVASRNDGPVRQQQSVLFFSTSNLVVLDSSPPPEEVSGATASLPSARIAALVAAADCCMDFPGASTGSEVEQRVERMAMLLEALDHARTIAMAAKSRSAAPHHIADAGLDPLRPHRVLYMPMSITQMTPAPTYFLMRARARAIAFSPWLCASLRAASLGDKQRRRLLLNRVAASPVRSKDTARVGLHPGNTGALPQVPSNIQAPTYDHLPGGSRGSPNADRDSGAKEMHLRRATLGAHGHAERAGTTLHRALEAVGTLVPSTLDPRSNGSLEPRGPEQAAEARRHAAEMARAVRLAVARQLSLPCFAATLTLAPVVTTSNSSAGNDDTVVLLEARRSAFRNFAERVAAAETDGVSVPLPAATPVDLSNATHTHVSVRGGASFVYLRRWVDELRAIIATLRAPLEKEPLWLASSTPRVAVFDYITADVNGSFKVVMPARSDGAPAPSDGNAMTASNARAVVILMEGGIVVRNALAHATVPASGDMFSLPIVAMGSVDADDNNADLRVPTSYGEMDGSIMLPIERTFVDVTGLSATLLCGADHAQLALDDVVDLTTRTSLAPDVREKLIENRGETTSRALPVSVIPQQSLVFRSALVRGQVDSPIAAVARLLCPLQMEMRLAFGGSDVTVPAAALIADLTAVTTSNNKEASALVHLPPELRVDSILKFQMAAPTLSLAAAEEVPSGGLTVFVPRRYYFTPDVSSRNVVAPWVPQAEMRIQPRAGGMTTLESVTQSANTAVPALGTFDASALENALSTAEAIAPHDSAGALAAAVDALSLITRLARGLAVQHQQDVAYDDSILSTLVRGTAVISSVIHTAAAASRSTNDEVALALANADAEAEALSRGHAALAALAARYAQENADMRRLIEELQRADVRRQQHVVATNASRPATATAASVIADDEQRESEDLAEDVARSESEMRALVDQADSGKRVELRQRVAYHRLESDAATIPTINEPVSAMLIVRQFCGVNEYLILLLMALVGLVVLVITNRFAL